MTRMSQEELGVEEAAPGVYDRAGYECKDGLRENKEVVRTDRAHPTASSF